MLIIKDVIQEMFEKIKRKGKEHVADVTTMLAISTQFFLMGTANLSAVFDLLDEIIANTDTIIGCVVLGVTIAVAVFIGSWVKSLLSKSIGGKK